MLRRLAFIRSAQRVGLSLEEITEACGPCREVVRRPRPTGLASLTNGVAGSMSRSKGWNAFGIELDSCIGCGCLSLQKCTLQNPDDYVSSRGPGAVYLDPSKD